MPPGLNCKFLGAGKITGTAGLGGGWNPQVAGLFLVRVPAPASPTTPATSFHDPGAPRLQDFSSSARNVASVSSSPPPPHPASSFPLVRILRASAHHDLSSSVTS